MRIAFAILRGLSSISTTSDVGAREHGGVVYAVAHEGQHFAGLLFGKQLLHLAHLILGQKLAENGVYAKLLRHALRDLVAVTGEHDGLLHADALERADGVLRVGLHHVADEDMPAVLAVYRHMHHRADVAAFREFNAELLHQPVVARGDVVPVHLRRDAVAAYLLHVAHAAFRPQ